MTNVHLILGGARSGKSRLAESLAQSNGKPVHYIATAEIKDPEMSYRVSQHQARRPSHWTITETPLLLAETLNDLATPNSIVLVDCLTLWLSNWLCSEQPEQFQMQKRSFLKVIENKREVGCDIILVSNEVGYGIVPMGELSRQFVDESGWLHQDIAAIADKVDFVMAGLAMPLKPMGRAV